MDQSIVMLFVLALRIVGIFVCVSKAKELNRSTGVWGVLGFFFPVVAMIWIQFMKPVIKFDEK